MSKKRQKGPSSAWGYRWQSESCLCHVDNAVTQVGLQDDPSYGFPWLTPVISWSRGRATCSTHANPAYRLRHPESSAGTASASQQRPRSPGGRSQGAQEIKGPRKSSLTQRAPSHIRPATQQTKRERAGVIQHNGLFEQIEIEKFPRPCPIAHISIWCYFVVAVSYMWNSFKTVHDISPDSEESCVDCFMTYSISFIKTYIIQSV